MYNDWINENYKLLSLWAKRWSPSDWRELLAHYTLYLEKNWSKFSLIPDGEERIKWTQKWFKNTVKWKNSDFNKTIEVNNLNAELYWFGDTEYDFLGGSRVEQYEVEYDVLAEDLSQDIKDFVIDLKRRFSEQEVIKIITIRKIYLTLTTPEKVLYDLYFTQELSIRQVAKKLQLPTSSVHVLIVALRKKIKDLC